jgi:hypothetical protein
MSDRLDLREYCGYRQQILINEIKKRQQKGSFSERVECMIRLIEETAATPCTVKLRM